MTDDQGYSDERYSDETCDECGFVGRDWSPERAVTEPGLLAAGWRGAFEDRSDDDLRQRPKPEVWSAVEYTVHTSEVLRFWHNGVVTVVAGGVVSMPFENYPDADRFPYNDTQPQAALASLEAELVRLGDLATSLSEDDRRATLRLDDPGMQQGWADAGVDNAFACLLHAIHDTAHHLDDVKRGLASRGGPALA